MAIDELTSLCRLLDLSFLQDPHAVFARLRREAPVFWYDPAQCWAISKYGDCRDLLRAPEIFSSEQGFLIGDNLKEDRGRGGFPPDGEAMVILDPPRHHKLRRIVSKAFTPARVAELEPRIRAHVVAALDALEPGEVVDFVEVFAKPIPALVMMELLGVPEEKQPDFARWMEAMLAYVTDPDLDVADASASQELFDCWMWFLQSFEERRARPGDDLISGLLTAEVEGERLTDMNLVTFCVILLGGGLETSRNLATGAIKAMSEHPDQRALLLQHPELLPTATEEFLRWITPAMAFGRTTTQTTEIRGQTIEAGEYVVALFQSANRDEDVWERADQLDLARHPEPMHLGFSIGPHLCLGAALARLEFRVMFEEFLKRFPRFELAGQPERLRSILINGFVSMPVSLN